MERRHCRSHRATAVLGLIAGLALLIGAALDGGMSTPSRIDLDQPTASAPSQDRSAPRLAESREDVPTWGLSVPSSRIPAVVPGLAALVAAASALVASRLASDPRHRAPAVLAARHRGPPPVV